MNAIDVNTRECYACGKLDYNYTFGLGWGATCTRCGSHEIHYVKGL
jgi:ribosomal protein L37E